MDGELLRQAELLFGEAAAPQTPDFESESALHPSADPKSKPDDHDTSKVQLTARQERKLWRHVGSVENFWETLKEIEPGVIARLWPLATTRGWEIIFLTKRPPSGGATAQIQSQRWLAAHGVPHPSVFVVQGSRGKIAAPLALDFVVDDRPENCRDVVVDSRARAILVWRDDQNTLPSAAKRLGIGVVKSVDECLS